MKIVKVVIALAIIVGVAYWAFDSVRERAYAGSQVEFAVGSGNTVTIVNSGEEAVPLVVTSRSTFGMTSSNPDLVGSPVREGTGRDVVYRHETELPAGSADFRITRGSDITFSIDNAGSVNAVVTPLSPDSARTTLIFAGVVMLAALFYISNTFQHRWIKAIRQKLSSQGTTPAQQSSASEASS
jgi:hypothetical protein